MPNYNGRYRTSESEILRIKDEYLDSSLNMKDFLNGQYDWLPFSDKVNLICWSGDWGVYHVNPSGRVVDVR